MLTMEAVDEEEFLSLRLSTVTDYGYEKKRKRTETISANKDRSYSSDKSCDEGKIFFLLQLREQMMKLDSHHNTRLTDDQEDDRDGLRLIHSLLIVTNSVSENNFDSALHNLFELYRNTRLRGVSVQRVAAYFSDALLAKLLTRKSPFYDAIVKIPNPNEEFLASVRMYKALPLHQFAHFTANQAILEAFQREMDSNNRCLHVIDFDVSYGFQWPCLMQSLSEILSPGDRILLKITGFGKNLEEIQETESRLVSFAKGFRNLVFEFHGFARGSKLVMKTRKKNKNETVAVNFAFHLNTLNSGSKLSETLNHVRSLSPSIVVLVEQEGSRNSHSFLARFMESLHYFSAIFDSLDSCLPLDSAERLSIERNLLGKEIKRAVTYDRENGENCTRFEKIETWRSRMESHGFTGIKHSSVSVMQAKLLMKMRSHSCDSERVDGENSGFRVFEREDGQVLSLGWQERLLVSASSWCCVA